MGLYLIAESFWLDPSNYLAMLKVALGLGAVIFVHELGHFLVAKACGVKCEKFYIGFDFFDIKIGSVVLIPRALLKFKWGETEYGIGIIPLGGYVKMLGQDDNPANAAKESERTKVRKEEAITAGGLDMTEPVSQASHEKLEHDRARHEKAAQSHLLDSQRDADDQWELDPRSYQAKSVPQRMAIISAGVTMNLIFAVVFATIAYQMGVSNTPTIIGGTLPGGPAWTAGLRPGDKIIQLGRNGKRSEFLRFRDDLANAVVMNGDQQDLELLVRRANGTEEWISVRPTKDESMGFASIGVAPAATTRLSSKQPVVDFMPAARAKPAFEGGDEIVAINGEAIDDYQHLKQYLLRHSPETLTVTVERSADKSAARTAGKQRVELTVAPNPQRDIGLVMTMGPINAIQQDSPADHAGLKVGDVIQAIDGQPVGDPLTLPNRLLEKVGQEIQIEVARTTADANGAATRTFTMTPQYPASTLGPIAPGIPMSSEELGIAYDVLNRVAYVEPDSPAEQAAVQAGDVITRVEFVPAGEQQKKDEQEKLFLLDKPINLDDEHLDWPFVDTRLQRSLPDTQIKITFQRGKQEKTVQLLPVDSQHWFDPNRGFMLTAREEEFQAASWGDALMLGLRQTKEDALKIVAFLQKLVTRKLPVTGLGGPGAIAVFATSEASESTSRLLIFLTLLSANLAVVNFLPIPVLDGGHMMFLIAEGIRGKPISEKWLIGLTLAGFAFVVSLMLFVIGLDVFRFSGWAG